MRLGVFLVHFFGVVTFFSCHSPVASETLIAEEQQKLEGYKLELKKWQVHKKNLEKLFQEIDNDV